MNNSNPLEKQLRSWRPRPPAAHLKDCIFGGQAAAQSSWVDPVQGENLPGPAGRFTWQCLAPAMALFVFMLFVSGPGSEGTTSHQLVYSNKRFSEETVREPTLVTYLAEAIHSPHNNCLAATLEWTNEDPSLTTAAPVPGTNSLFQ